MGKRSRKRGSTEASATTEGVSPAGTTRAERDAARRRRAVAAARGEPTRATPRRRRPGRPSIDERPPAPWGNFPLGELVVLLALVLFVGGLVTGGGRGQVMLTGALVLGSLAGLELSIREHFSGFRSHTTLLAAVCGFVGMAATFFAAGKDDLALALMLPVAGIAFMASWWVLREAFKRRSGGLGFR